MINHEPILNKTKIIHTYKALTDVEVLKFDLSTFTRILYQFPDIKESLNIMLSEQKNNQQSDIKMHKALTSKRFKSTIISSYIAILDDKTKKNE